MQKLAGKRRYFRITAAYFVSQHCFQPDKIKLPFFTVAENKKAIPNERWEMTVDRQNTLDPTIELVCCFHFATVAVPCVPCDTKNWRHKSGNAKNARNRNGRKVLLSETWARLYGHFAWNFSLLLILFFSAIAHTCIITTKQSAPTLYSIVAATMPKTTK